METFLLLELPVPLLVPANPPGDTNFNYSEAEGVTKSSRNVEMQIGCFKMVDGG